MLVLSSAIKVSEGSYVTGRIQIGIRTRCHTNVDDSMTINRISTGRMTLMFSFYFNFIINVSANIW